MKNRILLLGGSHGQLPAIHEARNRGLYTILCDYLPNNPGAKLADEFHLISTTDKAAVLELAEFKKIDYVLAFASDPATPTAAFVSEKLGLPGSSLESIRLLSEKHLFRNLLNANGFNTPAFRVISSKAINGANLGEIPYPVVVKPVDSSDTKGVTRVNHKAFLQDAVQIARDFSRQGKVIIEDYIEPSQANLHGDAFFLNGEMVFSMLGDSIFRSKSNPLKPSIELYPSRAPTEIISKAEKEIEEIVRLCDFRNGAINIEARVDAKGNLFVMEIGPRSGGTLTPQTIYYATGFNMLKATFDFFLNGSVKTQGKKHRPAICCALHTNQEGRLKKVAFDEVLNKHIAEKHLYVEPGEEVLPYSQPGSTIGVLILQFNNFDEVDALLGTLYERIQAGIVLE